MQAFDVLTQIVQVAQLTIERRELVHDTSDDRCGTEMDKHVAPGMRDEGLLAGKPVRSCDRARGVQRALIRTDLHPRQSGTT